MDKQRTKKKSRFLLPTIGGVLLAATLAYLAISGTYDGSLTVKEDRLSIRTVSSDQFYEYINVSGTIEPRETYFIDSKVSGNVQEVYVESGAELSYGDTLLRITNADLRLEVMQRESQLIEQLNNQRQTRLLINQNNLNQQEQLAEVRYQLSLQQKQFNRNKELYEEGVISERDYEPVAERYHYFVKRQDLLRRAYETDSMARDIQLQQIDGSERRILRNLDAVQQILDRLYVTARAGGQLSDFEVQTGQALTNGQRLGQIYNMDRPRIVALVDEFYLDKVDIGQPGIALQGGDTVRLQVSKIFPTVEEGRFQVYMGMAGTNAESGFIKGQSVRVRLFFGEPAKCTLLPTGNFYNSSGGNWVYVVDGEHAVRRPIELGRKNPNYYEVLDGLEPGEQVITSSYDRFNDYDIINFSQ